MDWRRKVEKKAKGLGDGETVLAALMTNPLGFTTSLMGKELGGMVGRVVVGRDTDLGQSLADGQHHAPEGSMGARVPEGHRGVLAITDRRWTFHKHSALTGNPGALVTEWAHDEVVGHVFEKARMASTLALVFADGSVRALEIPMLGDVQQFVTAAAKVGAPA